MSGPGSMPGTGGAAIRRVRLASTASSMRDARGELASAPAGPVVVRADTQTAAVGRLGRSWVAPAGGLWFTAGWPIDDRAVAGPAAILAGVAVVRAAEALGLEAGRAGLRWPNDVLVDGRKLSGVLCETFELGERLGERGGRFGLLVGVGINANLRPDRLPGGLRTPPVTLLELLGRSVDLDDLLEVWLEAFAAGLRRIDRGRLDPGDRDAAEGLLCGRGARVRVMEEEGAGVSRTGVQLGLDRGGGLRLGDGGCGDEIVLRSGEVSIRPV